MKGCVREFPHLIGNSKKRFFLCQLAQISSHSFFGNMDLRQTSIILLILLPFCFSQSISSYFSRLEYHKLDGKALETVSVHSEIDCGLKCSRVRDCQSVNFGVNPDKNGLHQCILLKEKAANEMYGPLEHSNEYHHLTRMFTVSKSYFANGFLTRI